MSAILGVLFAALMGLVLIPSYMHYEKTGVDNARIATTAEQFKLISEAVKGYIQVNYVAIEAASTASSPATITVPALQATGFLAAGFNSVNPYNQTWFAQVLQPTPGNLQALVLSTGGDPIEQVRAPLIASQAGAQGGFIPYNGQYGTLNSTVAQGSYGGWQVSMNGYSNPGSGHLAGLLFFNNGNLANNYLYRVAVPGHPELNQMQTNLDMNNNDINNAQDVTVKRDLEVDGGTLHKGPSRNEGPTTFGAGASFDTGAYLYVDDIYLRSRNQWLSYITPKMVFVGAIKLGSQYILGGMPVTAQQSAYAVSPPDSCAATGGAPKIDLIPQSIPDYSGTTSTSSTYTNYKYNWGLSANWTGSYWYVVIPSGVPVLANIYCYFP